MSRQLKNAQITHVSLVDKGANNKTFAIVKSDAAPVFEKQVTFLKSENDQRLATGVVYEPDVPDAHDDFMIAEDIEKAAHQFMTDYRHIDKQHDFISNVGDVVESWVAKSDMTIADQEITAGTWVMTVKVSDDDMWESIKNNEVTGFSMAGLAETIQKQEAEPTPSDDDKGLLNVIKSWLINKGAVRDEFNRTKARRDLWSVFSALEDEYDSAIWNNHTPQPADFERIENATQEFLEILSEIKTPADIEKVLKQKPKEASEDMKPEDIAKAIEDGVTKAIEPVTERLAKLEKGEENQPELTEEEKLAELVSKAVQSAVDPLSERLTKMEKARSGSQQTGADHQGNAAPVAKSYMGYLGAE